MGSKGKRSSGSSNSSSSTCGPRLHNAAAAAHAPPPALLATTTPAAALPSTNRAPKVVVVVLFGFCAHVKGTTHYCRVVLSGNAPPFIGILCKVTVEKTEEQAVEEEEQAVKFSVSWLYRLADEKELAKVLHSSKQQHPTQSSTHFIRMIMYQPPPCCIPVRWCFWERVLSFPLKFSHLSVAMFTIPPASVSGVSQTVTMSM
ncbi:unnamed protein product [Sphagnum tenellum]